MTEARKRARTFSGEVALEYIADRIRNQVCRKPEKELRHFPWKVDTKKVFPVASIANSGFHRELCPFRTKADEL